jgi:hypothetical protein
VGNVIPTGSVFCLLGILRMSYVHTVKEYKIVQENTYALLKPILSVLGPLYVMIQVMIHGVSAGATVPFSPLALVPPPSSRPDVGGTYAIIRVCYRPLLADRCETPPRAPIIY